MTQYTYDTTLTTRPRVDDSLANKALRRLPVGSPLVVKHGYDRAFGFFVVVFADGECILSMDSLLNDWRGVHQYIFLQALGVPDGAWVLAIQDCEY